MSLPTFKIVHCSTLEEIVGLLVDGPHGRRNLAGTVGDGVDKLPGGVIKIWWEEFSSLITR